MFGYVQTAVEGIWIVAVFLGIVFFTGYGATRMLLPDDWRRYRVLLTPVVGWSVLILASFTLNLAVGMQLGLWVILAVALLVNLAAFIRDDRDTKRVESEPMLPLFFGVCLIALGLLPHIAQRSFSLLSLNQDDEIYFPAAHYVLTYPIIGGPHGLGEYFLEGIRRWGFGFQYAIAAASAASGSTVFQAYFPVSYALLGLTVPAWYLLFREVLGLRQRTAIVGCFFYTLLGLPLWFANYGYGSQMGSLIATPVGIAAFVAAVRLGGRRRLVMASLFVAAGLTSYYLVIALHFSFVFLLVVVVAVLQQRGVLPLMRAILVAVMAFLVGLPSHWHVINYYFIDGAIRNTKEMLNGGWGIDTFQPPWIMLGLDAFQIMHDGEGAGPFASFDGGLNLLAIPVCVLLLVLATIGLLTLARKRPMAVATVAGTAAYMLYVRYVQNFPYGYLKLMPVAAPLVYGLVANAGDTVWRPVAGRLPRSAIVFARYGAASFSVIVTILLAYNTYEAVWFDASGWGQSIPNWVDPGLRDMARIVQPGSSIFVTGRYEYPVPSDRIQLRQNSLGMRSDKEQRQTWAKRIRVMALTNLEHANVYGYFDNRVAFSHFHRLLEGENYDYYLLASTNDPRLEGLDASDVVWSDPGLALYSSRNAVRKTPWTLMKERGSLAITPSEPLIVGVSAGNITTDGVAEAASQPEREGRLRIGILTLTRSEATVQTGNAVHKLALDPGITWYTTPDIPIPSSVVVRPNGEGELGVVALRLLGEGNEEKDFVPASEIGDTIYASSTVLPVKEWLTDPFQGKKPGSD